MLNCKRTSIIWSRYSLCVFACVLLTHIKHIHAIFLFRLKILQSSESTSTMPKLNMIDSAYLKKAGREEKIRHISDHKFNYRAMWKHVSHAGAIFVKLDSHLFLTWYWLCRLCITIHSSRCHNRPINRVSYIFSTMCHKNVTGVPIQKRSYKLRMWSILLIKINESRRLHGPLVR